jgi:mRNA interferase RelE/StbE
MKAAFRKSFVRDLKKISDQKVRERVGNAIKNVESALSVAAIDDLRKITGTANFYRIRIGEYRIGLTIESGTVEFVRCLPRRDLYRYFP